MVDAYGAITWWGFSPALDLQDEDFTRKLSKLAVAEEKNEKDSLQVLLIGVADLRHILKTLALMKRHRKKRIKFFVIENNLEVIARQLLFASIFLEPKEKLGLKEKVELFLELFGNSLVRPQTDEFLKRKANELIRFVTDPEYLKDVFPFVNLSSLKFKERDQLEAIFKFWRTTDRKHFDICSLWDQRIRRHLSTRYDSRMNSYDWDYTMKLREKAPIINFREYKTWRESGVAFELREDSSYEACNRTLASGIIHKVDGDRVARRGYWGDIINSPFLSFGIESEEKSLFEQTNGIHTKMSTNVSEHNITAWIYELITGEPYRAKAPRVSQELSPSTEEEKLENISEVDESEVVMEGEPERNASENANVENNGYFLPEDCTIDFLPLDCFQDLSRKSKYKHLFNVVYFSNSMVHLLKDGLRPIIAENAKLIIETSNFMLDLKKEVRGEYNKKVKGLAEASGFQMIGPCDDEKDPFAFFAYTESQTAS